MSDNDATASILRILQHTPASHTKENILALNYLFCNDNDDSNQIDDSSKIRQRINQLVDSFPLVISNSGDTLFVCTEFNRVACDNNGDDVYRAPDTSSDAIEGLANELFATYSQMYYGKGAVSSVYLNDMWEHQQQKVASLFGCFAIVNVVDDSVWNSVHVVQVITQVCDGNIQDGTFDEDSLSSTYKVDSSIFISVNDGDNARVSKTSGIIRKQCKKEKIFRKGDKCSHIANIGNILEDIEFDIRSSLDSLYLQKSKDTACKGLNRINSALEENTPGRMHSLMLNDAVLARASLRENSNT